ncbi:MAG: DNA-binding NtrC family response regulator [Yoonia sp.]
MATATRETIVMDTINTLSLKRAPTALRPLLGQAVLVVEDSRFASKAVRMMCLRSGARIRRADSLKKARRHLAIYLPTVLLVDVGLPDGSGIGLIKPLADASPRIDVINGTSGDATLKDAVTAAAADNFLEKPVESLLVFQTMVLAHLPADRQPPSPRLVRDEVISPDLIAYQDDLCHVAQVLGRDSDNNTLDYVTHIPGRCCA